MNFKDVLMTVELVLKSKAVPMIVGESGIGKTALAKELAERNNYYYVNIDGNMLKEGEIGGLPTVEEHSMLIGSKEVKRKVTTYAIHSKFLEINNIIELDNNREILLFIDELNRCEHSVQQELMNIILNREINGYILPKKVHVIAAMNPSINNDGFSRSEYQVVDMDPAQEDRFVWIEMDADVQTWIQWGMDGGRINNQILEFIAAFPEYLHTPYAESSIKTTPRSWERVSNAYNVYLNDREHIPERILFNVIKGNVGQNIAQDFMNFIKNYSNPIIAPEELLKEAEISNELADKIQGETHSRLYLMSKNALNYINESKDRKREILIFCKILNLYPNDLKMAIMKEIKNKYPEELYKEFLHQNEFIKGYFDMYKNFED
ncbi:MAG: ATPase [Clostridiaceae bacterium]|jgi:nucleoside-triphosphatase THEP1|nr:ATPase [Clostridiaceae bacterium]